MNSSHSTASITFICGHHDTIILEGNEYERAIEYTRRRGLRCPECTLNHYAGLLAEATMPEQDLSDVYASFEERR